MAGKFLPPIAKRQAQLERGEQQATGKVIQWSLWDTHKLATGDLDVQMFQIPIGQPGNGFVAAKTLIQTNGRGAGTIPKGQKFEAHALVPYLWTAGATINNATLLAIQNWMRQGLFQVKFPGGDDLLQERMDFIWGEQKQTVLVPTVAGDNIFPQQLLTPVGYYKLNKKILFAALDSYEIHMNNIAAVAAALNTFEITWRFVGILKRLSA